MEHLKHDHVRQKDPLLVVIPSVPISQKGDGYVLDEKAVAGLEYYLKYWPGSVRSVFRGGDPSGLLFGKTYSPSELPFEVRSLPSNATVPDELISDASVVLAAGDNWLDFPVADQGLRLNVPVCYVIENTLKTRLQIISMSDASLFRKTKSCIWTIMTERDRRRAFARSSGLQSNGTPAAETYGGLTPNLLTFFDTRLSEKQMATDQEIAAKQERLVRGEPLRLAFTGRLENIKGADDLIRIAVELDRAGKVFSLDIYGDGSLEPEMTAALNDSTASLRQNVRIHRPVDFNRKLVPWMRSQADLFLCCHRQSDPSCTYLETLGCGVPIVGYGNRAWRGILNLADVGWVTSMGARDEMVRTIIDLDENRAELADKMRNALNFAKAHSFETEFKRRADHLWHLAKDQKAALGRRNLAGRIPRAADQQ